MVAVIYLVLAMAVAAVLGATGQIAMKYGTNQPTLMKMIPYLALFATLYGVAVLINIWAYRAGGKVSILYPVISLSYIFAAFFAWKLLGESISSWTIAGTALIVIGVGIIGYGATI